MIKFIIKYKAFLIGLVITRVLTLILLAKGVILIDNDEILTNVLGFLIYWILISVFIHRLQFFKDNLKTVIKIIGLILFLIGVLIVDSNSDVKDNPITILVLIVFYITFTYVILPKFFTKYKWIILGVYGTSFALFLYYRLFSESFEVYEQQKSELFLLFLVPIPVLICLWLYEQWKWVQNLKAEKSQTELSLLRTQINPHFFFNTLNNLYALTVKNSKQAPEVILKLSDMMRYTIYEGEKEVVLLLDEINYLENYIELHKIRYKKSVEITFDHDIDTSLKIAPLLYIILLENAFKHGVETLAENALIHMSLYEKGDFIHFEIENNFDPNERKESNGIGLQNLKRRLSLLYKDKHELLVESTNNSYKTSLKISKHA